MSLGGSQKCNTCGKSVYPMEKFSVDGLVFHKGKCFVCEFCKGTLRPGNYASLSGKYYCKPHFKKLFQVKGNYSEGFGEDDPKKKWAPSGIAAPPKDMKTAAGASEKKEEGKTLERRISLKGLTMKEIEHAQTLFEKYDTNYDKKIDKEEFLQLWKDLTAAKGEKEGAYALKKKAADGYEKFAAGGDGITDALFLQVYSDLMLAEHMKAEEKEGDAEMKD